MAGIYREKTCPTCGVTHRRRGPYCSRSCGAKNRIITDETKQKLSDSGKARYEDKTSDDYLNTVENVKAAALKSKGINPDPIPPQFRNEYIDDNHFVSSGDYWTVIDD
jgi:hypothetical protein